jgi:glutamate racemase
MTRRPRILLFDSGLGGLTVARAVRALLPDAHYLYGADVAAFPYGAWDEPLLIERIVAVMARLIAEARPDVVVVACNTASTLALARLRETFAVPFVGTVPAIKARRATDHEPHHRGARHAGDGQPGIYPGPHRHLRLPLHRDAARRAASGRACRSQAHGNRAGPGCRAPRDRARVSPPGRRRTDTVVLGCTHYPLLLPDLEAASPWPVSFIDPAPAIARRVAGIVATLPARPPEAAYPAPDGTVFLTATGASSSLAVLCGAGVRPPGAGWTSRARLSRRRPRRPRPPPRTCGRPADR